MEIKELHEIYSENMKSSKLYLNYINQEVDYDDQSTYYIGKEKGNNAKWDINNNNKVTSLNVSMDVGYGEKITLKIYK